MSKWFPDMKPSLTHSLISTLSSGCGQSHSGYSSYTVAPLVFVLILVLILKERSKSSGSGCIWAHVSVSNLLIFLGHVDKEELLLTNVTVKLQKNYKYIS